MKKKDPPSYPKPEDMKPIAPVEIEQPSDHSNPQDDAVDEETKGSSTLSPEAKMFIPSKKTEE